MTGLEISIAAFVSGLFGGAVTLIVKRLINARPDRDYEQLKAELKAQRVGLQMLCTAYDELTESLSAPGKCKQVYLPASVVVRAVERIHARKEMAGGEVAPTPPVYLTKDERFQQPRLTITEVLQEIYPVSGAPDKEKIIDGIVEGFED